jgi:hypothetical protein
LIVALCQYLTGRVLKAGDEMSAAEQQHVFALNPIRPQPQFRLGNLTLW